MIFHNFYLSLCLHLTCASANTVTEQAEFSTLLEILPLPLG